MSYIKSGIKSGKIWPLGGSTSFVYFFYGLQFHHVLVRFQRFSLQEVKNYRELLFSDICRGVVFYICFKQVIFEKVKKKENKAYFCLVFNVRKQFLVKTCLWFMVWVLETFSSFFCFPENKKLGKKRRTENKACFLFVLKFLKSKLIWDLKNIHLSY